MPLPSFTLPIYRSVKFPFDFVEVTIAGSKQVRKADDFKYRRAPAIGRNCRRLNEPLFFVIFRPVPWKSHVAHPDLAVCVTVLCSGHRRGNHGNESQVTIIVQSCRQSQSERCQRAKACFHTLLQAVV